MTQEGELKKRMWKVLGNHMTDSDELGVPEVNKMFDEVLDEAAKEFPFGIEIKDPDFNRIFQQNAYMWNQKFPELAIEWFKKWFLGSEQP